jgi:hypothetical protein
MAGSVVQTGSEPKPDPMELDLMVQFQVWGAPPNLTSVQFEVLGFQSKNRMEPAGTGLRQHYLCNIYGSMRSEIVYCTKNTQARSVGGWRYLMVFMWMSHSSNPWLIFGWILSMAALAEGDHVLLQLNTIALPPLRPLPQKGYPPTAKTPVLYSLRHTGVHGVWRVMLVNTWRPLQDTPWALQLVVTYCFKCCD